MTVVERIIARCARQDRGYITPCLIFTGKANNKGYAIVQTGSLTDGSRRTRRAHIVIWEAMHGRVPDGLELDHLCNQRGCCEHTHMEAVTHEINLKRGALRRRGLPIAA